MKRAPASVIDLIGTAHQFQPQFYSMDMLRDQYPGVPLKEVFDAVAEAANLDPPDLEPAGGGGDRGRSPDIDGDRDGAVP